MVRYGYIRVSTKEQNLERQLVAMQEMGILAENIYEERKSGKDFERPIYRKLLSKLHKDDLLVIKSIDRLGRNYDEILKQWRIITQEIGADIQVIDMPLLNTQTHNKDLMGNFVADLVLQILAYVAETERVFIKQRQAEGIAVAKAKGVQFGKRRKEYPKELKYYVQLWKSGNITIRRAAEELNMNYSTFYRRCKEWENIMEKS